MSQRPHNPAGLRAQMTSGTFWFGAIFGAVAWTPALLFLIAYVGCGSC